MGKKIIDFVTRRDGSRGRKSKAGGGIKSKAAQLYTPLIRKERKMRVGQKKKKKAKSRLK